MFADDTKIFREIKTRADFIQFQEDIDHLLTWSDKWQFNNSKYYILHLIPMEIILRWKYVELQLAISYDTWEEW